MLPRLRFLALAACLAATGCGPRPVTGGTPGMLRAGGEPFSEIQVTVYSAEGGPLHPIGFGVTAADGSFALFKNEARGPLVLTPGEYHCTLESAGAPVRIPPEYARADTTPLQVSWSTGDQNLNLEIPVQFAIQ